MLLVNGSISFNPLWVRNTGLVSDFPSQTQLVAALSNVQVTAGNASATYANFIVSVNQRFYFYSSLVRIPFLQMVAAENFKEIETVLKTFFNSVPLTGD